MNEIAFEIPGQAVPWHRPVLYQRLGRIIVGKRNEDKKWQGIVKLYATLVRPPALPAGPVILQVEFALERPKSLPKRVVHHIKKPDTDNLVKNIKDALTGSLYKDDAQVFKSIEEKRYCIDGEKPRVIVKAFYL